MTENITTISCSDCVGKAADRCGDCIVTFLCEREPDDAVVFDAAEERAVRLLSKAGLVGELRYERVG
jgi:hypothetical protein